MTQYHVSKGLKVFGKDGIAAVDKELRELVMWDVIDPLDPDKMKWKDKKEALQYLMFLTKKQCRRIKGKGCVDSCKHHQNTHCDNVSSPTVSTSALMLSCVIDVKENNDVATIDVPNAFKQANMDKLVNMKIEGSMDEILVKIKLALYRKHLRTEKEKLVLYVCLKKALYGTMRVALLYWENLSDTLQEWGIEINPYYWCVANKDINGSQHH
eukprot:6280512-Ditylum_brightwellii.AAC.1